MLASLQSDTQPASPALLGLMQRSFTCLLEQSQSRGSDLALSASYLEIYNEQVSACPAAHSSLAGTLCPAPSVPSLCHIHRSGTC